MGRIVVGVDGSEHSRAALRWAVAEATLRGDVVEALMAWHAPYLDGFWVAPVPVDHAAIEKSCRAQLDEIVDGTNARGLSQPIERIVSQIRSRPCATRAGRLPHLRGARR